MSVLTYDEADRLLKERDKLRAENERLREALETLADGACHDSWSGCDVACRRVAQAALDVSDPSTSPTKEAGK